MWYCFGVPKLEIGCAIYYAYTPNASVPTAKFTAYLTRGWAHRGADVLYTLERTLPIPAEEWDDLDVAGLCRYRRLEPLKRWHISFADRPRLAFDLAVEIVGGNWHWIDHPYETPNFMSGDRYHRAFAGAGSIEIDGERHEISTTGDSDHSWGPRRWGSLSKCKYVAVQCGTEWSMSMVEVVDAIGRKRPYGHVWDGSCMTPITYAEIAAEYDEYGMQRKVFMNIVDERGTRTGIATRSYAAAPIVLGDGISNDCYVHADVEGISTPGVGVLSFYWDRTYYERVMNHGRPIPAEGATESQPPVQSDRLAVHQPRPVR